LSPEIGRSDCRRVPEKGDPAGTEDNAGNVIFFIAADGRLHKFYYHGTSWHSVVVIASGAPVTLSGPFDITPDCTYDNAQVFFRGGDGHIMAVYTYGISWVADHLICPGLLHDSSKCVPFGHIRCANGMVAYNALSDSMEAYYFGVCGHGPRI
jgi:hypothetical protein